MSSQKLRKDKNGPSLANIYDPWNNPIVKTRVVKKRRISRKMRSDSMNNNDY